VARRHVDISDDNSRMVSEALAQKVLGVACLSDDVESGLGEESGDPLAQQNVVFADHHAQRL
jgi:hypothetical protein